MKKYIFITHSSHDAEKAKKVRDYLETNGIQCWMAPRDIPVGAEWAEAILDGIENASGMLLIFSSNSNDSSQVRREIERAIHNDLPVFPVRIENVVPSKAMEYYISSNHWMDVFGGNFENNLKNLVDAIKTKAGFTDDVVNALGNQSQIQNEPLVELQTPLLEAKPEVSKQSRINRKLVLKVFIPVVLLIITLIIIFMESNPKIIIQSFEVNSGGIAENGSSSTYVIELSEDSSNIQCREIISTHDGGFALTGLRTPKDSLLEWSELWLKKFDSEGNEEWEYSSRSSNQEQYSIRSMALIQLHDSSFVCAAGISNNDSLKFITDVVEHLNKYGGPSRENDGSGYLLVNLDSNGRVLHEQEWRWLPSFWTDIYVTSLLEGDESGSVLLSVVRSDGYFYNDAYIAIHSDDQSLLNGTKLDSPGFCIRSNDLLYFVTIVTGGFRRMPYLSHIDFSSLRTRWTIAFTAFVEMTDEELQREMIFIEEIALSDSLLFLVGEKFQSAYRPTGSDSYILCSDTNGNTIWEIELDYMGPDKFTDIEIASNGDIIVCGTFIDDSVGITLPMALAVDCTGEILWKRSWSARVEQICCSSVESGELLFAVSYQDKILVLKTDSSGNIPEPRAFGNSSDTFVLEENWNRETIDFDRWSGSPELIQFHHSTERSIVINSSFLNLILIDSLLLKPGLRFDLDLMVSSSVEESNIDENYIEFGLMSEFVENVLYEETDAWSLGYRFNYGSKSNIGNATDSDQSVLAFLKESDSSFIFHSERDSLWIEYGEWNRFSVSVDSFSVDYRINNSLFLREIILLDKFDEDVFFYMKGRSSLLPCFIDSIRISMNGMGNRNAR
ncbi:MAG: toll/interleukin-1 receptor domain-containing protein [Candidatus Sabulitectum sp.]|nr:toll/interleukin-1 receptor domain-containing protein [Candidatus Sabulitectum sp.]